MARISFKTKAKTRHNADGTVAYQFAMVPVFTRSHCDMNSFRDHPTFGFIANSSLFPNALSKIQANVFGRDRDYFRLDRVPTGVTVDASSFLLNVSIEV